MSARALELAYRYVGRRERTVHELRQHLAARGLDESAVGAAVDQLIEQGYLDDARYARMFAQDKRQLEQWGSGRIMRTLLSRGVARADVEAALREDVGSGGDGRSGAGAGELQRAVTLLRRRFADPPRDRRGQQRALGMLLRRGYDPELAMQAISEVCAAGASVLRSS